MLTLRQKRSLAKFVKDIAWVVPLGTVGLFCWLVWSVQIPPAKSAAMAAGWMAALALISVAHVALPMYLSVGFLGNAVSGGACALGFTYAVRLILSVAFDAPFDPSVSADKVAFGAAIGAMMYWTVRKRGTCKWQQ